MLLGPTGVGKTAVAIALARSLDTVILSCDSRQIYKEMRVGTATPDERELAAATHYFVGEIPVTSYYSCWIFARQALALLEKLFARHDAVIMAGGAMLYIDAVCHGLDEMPDVDAGTRERVARVLQREGIDALREMLRELDPRFHEEVDLDNAKRVAHAVEVSLAAGRPYSSLRSGRCEERDFAIVKVGLQRDRAELYDRVNDRVDRMVAAGMEQEARGLYHLRHLNALNTVGYKEWFDHFDGKITRDEAILRVKRNTRHYAKKQLAWFRRDSEITWFHPAREENLIAWVRECVGRIDD